VSVIFDTLFMARAAELAAWWARNKDMKSFHFRALIKRQIRQATSACKCSSRTFVMHLCSRPNRSH